MNGSEQEAIDFMNWFCDLSYPHKIFICGNHDACLYRANIDGLDENVHYLCNSGVTINAINCHTGIAPECALPVQFRCDN